jgi:hypothetical protein
MAKRHRTDAAPPGASLPLRNVRLYGGREEQIGGYALASRGQPSPDRALVHRPRAELRREHDARMHRAHAQRAQERMLAAQDAVRTARRMGWDYASLAREARSARAAYLALTGAVQGGSVEVSVGSDTNKVRAV